MAWKEWPSAPRLTAPPETSTLVLTPLGRWRWTVRAPPLISTGTVPDGVPRAISSLLAPVLSDRDVTGSCARSMVTVAAPLLLVIDQRTLELSCRWRAKLLLGKMVKPRSDWSTRKTWVWGSNWTVGCSPLYSMCARYRSVDSAPPAMLTVAAPTLILSVASLTSPPGPTASYVWVAAGLDPKVT